MKQKSYALILIFVAASFILIACNGTGDSNISEGEKIIFVGPELVDCIDIAIQQCLQVKEDPQGSYTLQYDSIEGFDYEEGFEYEIRIRETEIDDPPTDGSAISWSLLEVIRKTEVDVPYPPPTDSGESEPIVGGEVLTVFVGPEMVDCGDDAAQKCLLVNSSPDAGYTLLYEPIAGFEFEPGFEYELQVLAEPVTNPTDDSAPVRYTLLEIVDKITIVAYDILLEESNWELQSYLDPDGFVVEVSPDSKIVVTYRDGKVIGTAGCNNYLGEYELNGSALQINILRTSQLSCEPASLMNQETAYLAALASSTSLDLSEESLQLQNAAGQTTLVYVVEEPVPITGTTWALQFYLDNQGELRPTIEDVQAYAIFGADGLLSGKAGCNDYSATYGMNANTILIESPAVTDSFCLEPVGIMEQETGYLTNLENATTFRKYGSDLVLFDADGNRLAAYQALGETEILDEVLASPEPITGIVWAWQSLTGPTGQTNIADPAKYTLQLDGQGGAIILADCNDGSGSYSLNERQLTINISSTTLTVCPPESLSDQFIRNINSTASFSIENGELIIELQADGGQMRFAPN